VARPGLLPEQTGVRVAVVQGSAQARFAAARSGSGFRCCQRRSGLALQQGRADGMLAPMMT
jgi:polar amino acid transport system substrate-binding protein